MLRAGTYSRYSAPVYQHMLRAGTYFRYSAPVYQHMILAGTLLQATLTILSQSGCP
jgi:hypothetical protein